MENLNNSPLAATTTQSAADELIICDLEYDVAGVGADEPALAEENQAAYFLVHYRLPENK
ncbi:hypothetical protein [Hydrocarboniphaga sp.]|uniref:hypothetical protein n=1 Tax=Hydrocarboniphaga sp. TaxID=2033016 RepID=UPI003D0B2194